MNLEHDESFAHSETLVAAGVRRAGGDAQAAVRAVADEVARELRRAGVEGAVMLSTISALADGAARAAADAGAYIGLVAEGFIVGAMRGARQDRERTLIVIAHAADSFVRHACAAGFDAVAAARGLVEGAASRAADCALDPGAAADAAARGALAAADDVGPRLGRKVRAALAAGRRP